MNSINFFNQFIKDSLCENFIFTTLLSFLKSTETVPKSSISNLSTSDFKLVTSAFLAKFNSSTPFVFYKSHFVA